MATAAYVKVDDLPQVIPVFPLTGALLLPRGGMPLNIFEPRYLNMIDDAMAGDRIIGMVQAEAGGDRERPKLARIGCAGRITSYAETSDGRYLITLMGVCRFVLAQELPAQAPYRQARVEYGLFEDDLKPAGEEPMDERPAMLEALKAYLERRGLDIDWTQALQAPLEAVVNSLAMALPFEPAEKQALLEAVDLSERRDVLVALLRMDAAAHGDDADQTLQ